MVKFTRKLCYRKDNRAMPPCDLYRIVSYRIGVEKRRLGSLFVLLLVSHFITITYHSNWHKLLFPVVYMDALYTWMPWNFRDSLITPIATIPNIFSWAFVPIEAMNVRTKFEVGSFTRSWDNEGYPKNLGTPWIRPRSLFSKIFNVLLFGLAQ